MPLQYFDEINSTNDYIRENIQNFREDFSGVYSFNQRKGKGQRGTEWIMEPEKNIAMTFCLTEQSVPAHNLSFWVSFVTSMFLEKETQTETVIKWPNDLLIRKKKVSGILIEKTENIFLTGIGINVLQERFDTLSKASSLSLISPKNYSLTSLVENLILYLKENFNLLHDPFLLEKYNSKLFGRNQVMTFRVKNITENGIIRKVDENGLLWVELENSGIMKFRNKEIQFLY